MKTQHFQRFKFSIGPSELLTSEKPPCLAQDGRESFKVEKVPPASKRQPVA
jgi:hypothetical protein